MTKFIIADGRAVYGIGDTPEEAHQDARQWMDPDKLLPLDDLPRRVQNDGSMYLARATAGLVAAINRDPQCGRDGNPDGIECTEEESELLHDFGDALPVGSTPDRIAAAKVAKDAFEAQQERGGEA